MYIIIICKWERKKIPRFPLKCQWFWIFNQVKLKMFVIRVHVVKIMVSYFMLFNWCKDGNSMSELNNFKYQYYTYWICKAKLWYILTICVENLLVVWSCLITLLVEDFLCISFTVIQGQFITCRELWPSKRSCDILILQCLVVFSYPFFFSETSPVNWFAYFHFIHLTCNL